MGDLLTGPAQRLGARVELRALGRRYGADAPAVDGVSLEIPAGSFLTLLGPSGSGKTTTLKMIAGFEVPDEGDILVGDRTVTGTPPHDRNIGMVFQNYALFPHMTVRDNVAFPLKMRRWTSDRISAAVADALRLVRLEGFAGRYPRQLSGGQQQRVALARAVVFNPPLLLMDEPLGALDRQLRAQVQVEIKRIQTDLGLTVVYVTHDQEEALFLSDRIALMRQGRVEQVGTPRELYDEPANRFVAEFLGESNVLPGKVAAATPHGEVEVEVGGRCLRGRTPQAVRPGQAVDVAVRPEKFRLSPAPGDNVLDGTVAQARFAGEAIRLVVRADAGIEITAKLPAQAGQQVPGAGDRCTLAWSKDDTRVFPG